MRNTLVMLAALTAAPLLGVPGSTILPAHVRGSSIDVAVAQVHVDGHFQKGGTYVRPHERSAPDGNPYNNYSFPGNLNPYTGNTAPGNPNTYLKNRQGLGSGSGLYGARSGRTQSGNE